MARQSIPTQPKVQTIAYSNLLGVDYQSDATEISRRHSPDMVNMVSDLGGNPVKRCGYRRVNLNDYNWRDFIEVGDTVYGVEAAAQSLIFAEVVTDDNGAIKQAPYPRYRSFSQIGASLSTRLFHYGGSVYIVQPNVWIEVFDLDFGGIEVEDISRTIGITKGVGYRRMSSQPQGISGNDTAYELIMPYTNYIPTVSTLLKPNGKEIVALPDGTDITGATEGVNLLTPFRTVEFCVQKDTVSELTFNLPAGVNGRIAERIKVEIRTGSGEWQSVSSTDYSLSGLAYTRCVSPDGNNLDDNSKFYCFGTYLPKITFATAPFRLMSDGENITNAIGTSSANAVPAYEPNLRVTYAVFNTEYSNYAAAGAGYLPCGFYSKARADLFSSAVYTLYNGRLFVSSANRVYYSQVGNPLKMYDDYYIELDTDIQSFASTSGGLAIICEGVKNVYIASGEYNDTYGMPVYTVRASNATIRLASPNCNSALNDEPIVITDNGICGLTTNYLSEKYSIMRSGKINRRLCAEEGYSSAVAIALNNYLYVAVGNHMYVLDGRHKDASRNGDNSYECYYFDNMPQIKRMWALGGRLYFAAINELAVASIYTWNDDLTSERLKYRDGLTWDSDRSRWTGGTPVKAKWTSAIDGDGIPQYYKTLQKKGTMVTLAPPMQTSCQVTLIRDGHDEIYVGRFDGSTFALTDAVLDAFTKKKVKKYKRLQFVVENNEDEPFGIVSIVKSFVTNNYAKR